MNSALSFALEVAFATPPVVLETVEVNVISVPSGVLLSTLPVTEIAPF